MQGDDVGAGAHRHLLVAGQAQLKTGDRNPGHVQGRARRPVLCNHRHLKGDAYLVQAAPLDDGDELTLLFDDGCLLTIHAQLAQGDGARHQRQVDELAFEDFDIELCSPVERLSLELALVARPTDGVSPLRGGTPRYQHRRGARDSGREQRRVAALAGLQIGGGNHRQVHTRTRICQPKVGGGGSWHRQGQCKARIGPACIQAIAQLHGHRAGLVGAPGKPVGSLHQLHRRAVYARIAERRAGR